MVGAPVSPHIINWVTARKIYTMELNQQHRAGLLERLEKINVEIESINYRMRSLKEDEKKNDEEKEWLSAWWDMDLFLAQKQKELITESIASSDIDY